MNKALYKAVMTRSRLRNKFIKNPNQYNSDAYKKYRNFCTGLFRKEKRLYYNNIDLKKITDNRKFWKTVKPLFSEKHFSNNKIILIEGDEIISDNQKIADTFNIYFANVVKSLDINSFNTYDFSYDTELDYISNIVEKFKNHLSIKQIKTNVKFTEYFQFESTWRFE